MTLKGYPMGKLQLLYLIGRAQMPVTNEQLILAAGGYDWINYFELQQGLLEMVQANMLEESVHTGGQKAYALTETGQTAVDSMEKDIPFSMRRRLIGDAAALRRAARAENEFFADYTLEGQDIVVQLKILEKGKPLMEIKLYPASQSGARALCDSWPKVAVALYGKLLLGEGGEE